MVYMNTYQEEVASVTVAPETLNVWVRVRHRCMDNLAKYSKMAIDAGLKEREVALAERYGQMIAVLLEKVLGDLALTSTQKKKAPEIVRARLLELEKGSFTPKVEVVA